MKKRLLALMLAMAMVMGMSMTAFAADETSNTVGEFKITDAAKEGGNTVSINKEYVVANNETTFPEETFTFTVEKDGEPVDTEDVGVDAYVNGILKSYKISVDSVKFDSATETTTKSFNINLPKYDAVGTYVYTFTENVGNTAGVTYDADTYTVRVRVYQDYKNGSPSGLSATVVVLNDNTKDETINNTYEASTLSVAKKVTGNMADKNKEFTVVVTFTAPKNAEGTFKDVKYAINYIDNDSDTATEELNNIKTVAAEWANGTATATIKLKHDETVTFKNIPYGVSYTVVENDYSAEGYKAPVYEYIGHFDGSDTVNGVTYTKTTLDANEQVIGVHAKNKEVSITHLTKPTLGHDVTITNEKVEEVDTGIFTNNMPYILALVAIAAVAVVMFRRKREF